MQRIDPKLPVPQQPTPFCSQYIDAQEFQVNSKNAFSRLQQKVKKANKAADKLQRAKDDLRRAAELVQGKHYVFCAIDIEAWEQDHSILLEIGWSLYDSKSDRYMDQHYLINSYRHLENGRYVSDQKMQFAFGTSVWCSLDQALKELKKDLDWCVQRDGGFVLVGHGLDSDLRYLRKAKFLWPGSNGRGDTLDVNQSALVTICNTDEMYAASISNLHNPPSLGSTLGILGIDCWNLHNAGNDAHYTMLLFMELIKKANG
ncbi:hypothetical protein BDB00DRAFT_775123 [Zychaea mexicana]|uniref:uncharacterized protein n=1 Tax=Zychaea mexicana TaxID=64656 RepID=UPI0022FF223F|nr:uncharacterized protein BDB00DRAFT_775123 [Zychaea mexicana]KAI9484336.1 hypothetical protein BDB00DRAFT_775123 [Zychaea mexicana]